MDSVTTILHEIMMGYTGEGWNAYAYLTHDPVRQMYMVITVGQQEGRREVDTDLIVRLDGNTIIIERDLNNKPLVDALVAAGIPRQQIILAYAGEPAPEIAA